MTSQTINTWDDSIGLEIGCQIDSGAINIGCQPNRTGDTTIGSETATGNMHIAGNAVIVQAPSGMAVATDLVANTVKSLGRITLDQDILFSTGNELFDIERGVSLTQQRIGGVLIPNTISNTRWLRQGDTVYFAMTCSKPSFNGLVGEFTITGLPYPVTTTQPCQSLVSSGSYFQMAGFKHNPAAYLPSGESIVRFNYMMGNNEEVATPLGDTEISDAVGVLAITGSYTREIPP